MFVVLFGRGALADHRVEHVEAQVPVADVGHQWKLEATLLELRRHGVGVFGIGAEVDAPLGPLDLGHVEVALLELFLAGHLLFFDRDVELVDERHGLAAVVEQAGFAVAGHAFTGIGLEAEVRVAHHHVQPVAHEFFHHVRARAHRPLVERQAVFVHPGLGVEGVGFPGQRRSKWQGHPVVPLRILPLQTNPQQVLFRRGGTGQRPAPKVEEGFVAQVFGQAGQQLDVFTLDALGVGLEAHHVLGEDREHRRLDAGGGVALERVDIVFGHHLARALMLKVERRALVGQLGAAERVVAVVAVLALGVDGKRRVRLVTHAGADGDVIDALGDGLAGCVVG